MKPELIVFDLAGNIVNSNKAVHRVLKRVFKKIRIRISIDEVNSVLGLPKPEAIKKLLRQHKYPYISDLLVMEMHFHFVKMMTEYYIKNESVIGKEDANEILKWCKDQGIKVAVDTVFDRTIAAPLLQRMEWESNGLINASISSDEVTRGRPFPDMIYRALELTGTSDVAKVAKVGDTIFDLQEGSSAGCGWVIGVTSGPNTAEQLAQGPHTHLIEKLVDLKQVFNP